MKFLLCRSLKNRRKIIKWLQQNKRRNATVMWEQSIVKAGYSIYVSIAYCEECHIYRCAHKRHTAGRHIQSVCLSALVRADWSTWTECNGWTCHSYTIQRSQKDNWSQPCSYPDIFRPDTNTAQNSAEMASHITMDAFKYHRQKIWPANLWIIVTL